MKRGPILSLLLALFILGGLLLLFPQTWMMLLQGLLVLLTLQVIVVRRHLYRIQAPTSLFKRIPAEQTASSKAAPILDATPPVEHPAGADAHSEAIQTTPDSPDDGNTAPGPASPPKATLDSSVFTRFQKALNSAESGTERPPAEDGDEENIADRVQLSSAAKRAAQAARPPTGNKPFPYQPAPPRQTQVGEEEEGGPDLFADLRPPPPQPMREPSSEAAALPEAKQPPEAHPFEAQPTAELPEQNVVPTYSATSNSGVVASGAADSNPSNNDAPNGELSKGEINPPRGLVFGAQADAPETPAAMPPPPAEEPGKVTHEGGTLGEEAAVLLRMGEEAATREDWESAQAGLTNYLAHLADQPELIHWRARHLETRMAIREGRDGAALQGFEAMLQAGFEPQAEAVPSLLDELLAGNNDEKSNSLRVSMLVRLLTLFRRQRDHSAMDMAYIWIVEAQDKAGDERRLLQYLKNHLEIRKALNDTDGQLELIDQLGNRCYKLGLTEEAKAYYEMGLRIRGGEPPPEGGMGEGIEGDTGGNTGENTGEAKTSAEG